ncbi:MAG: hypothetical protein HZA53_12150 [Planctomycetes bacterium]|nr:hypothetical protein [Planctomycetota bacterium]
MQPSSRDVLRGFLAQAGTSLAVALASWLLLLCGLTCSWGVGAFVGLLQIVWLFPWLERRPGPEGRSFRAGVWIGAALTLLLNGACYVGVIASLPY